MACPGHVRASFGPAVPVGCRGGFDFTLLFEQSILSLAPCLIFCIVVITREWRRRRGDRVPHEKPIRTSLLGLAVLAVCCYLPCFVY